MRPVINGAREREHPEICLLVILLGSLGSFVAHSSPPLVDLLYFFFKKTLLLSWQRFFGRRHSRRLSDQTTAVPREPR